MITVGRRFWYRLCVDNKEDDISLESPVFQNIIEDIYECQNQGELEFLPEWEDAVSEGIVQSREDYLSLLRDVSTRLTVFSLERNSDEDELTLIHLVRILGEVDRSLSGLGEKIEDYYIALHPAETIVHERNIWSLIDQLTKDPDHPLSHLAKEMQRFRESRKQIAKNVKVYAETTLPNVTALCGPLVAARLLAEAGSKKHLASMPASSLQVLGAGPSLFTHLVSGTSPPKHGIIFQYKGVRHSKKRNRGRVSRVLASQLGIAAKIDYFRGSLDNAFITKAGDRLCRAGERV